MERVALEEILGELVKGESVICVVRNPKDEEKNGYELYIGPYTGTEANEQMAILGVATDLTLLIGSCTHIQRESRVVAKTVLLETELEYKYNAPIETINYKTGRIVGADISEIIVGVDEIAEYLIELDPELKSFALTIYPDLDKCEEPEEDLESKPFVPYTLDLFSGTTEQS